MQGDSLSNTSTVLAHHKHCVVGAGAGDWDGRFSVHQAIVIALFLVNLFMYTTSITTSTVLLVLVMALALAMVSALQGSPRVLVFGGETNAFGGKIYHTNSNVAEFRTY